MRQKILEKCQNGSCSTLEKWQIYVKELNIELRANIHDDVFTAQQRRTQIL